MLSSTDKGEKGQTVPFMQLLSWHGMTVVKHDGADLSGRYLQHVYDIGNTGVALHLTAGGNKAVFTEAGEKFDRNLHGVLHEPDKPEPKKYILERRKGGKNG